MESGVADISETLQTTPQGAHVSPGDFIRTTVEMFATESSKAGRWSRDGADLLLQVRCAVYNGTLGAGFGHRFDRISNADLTFAKAA